MAKHYDAVFSESERDQFIAADPEDNSSVVCRSEWVHSAEYEERRGSLLIETKHKGQRTGKVYRCPISPAEAELFTRAPSKGGWLHDNGKVKQLVRV